MNTQDGSGVPDTAQWSVQGYVAKYAAIGASAQAAVDRWKQGDVIEGLPPVWLAPALDCVTGFDLTADGTNPDEITPVFDEAASVPLAIVSQTCDIGTTGPGAQHPFIHAVPLIPATHLSRSIASTAKQGACNYLVATAYGSGGGAIKWYADLRMLVSVSKAVLLDREPVEGFADSVAAARFAELAGGKIRRPALAGVLSEDLAKVVDNFVKGRGRGVSAIAHAEHVRVLVDEGTPLHPEAVSLIVVARVDLTAEEQTTWRNGVETEAKRVLSKEGVRYTTTLIQTPVAMSAHLYRLSAPLRVDSLGTRAWW